MARWSLILGVILLSLGGYLLFQHQFTAYDLVPFNPPKELKFSEYEGWRDFQAPTGFSVKFPFEPQHAAQSIQNTETQEKRHYDMYVSETPEGKMFMVSVITFTGELSKLDDKQIMQKFIMEMVDRKDGNTLSTMTPQAMANTEGLNFKIDGKQAIIIGTVLIKGKRLYLLTEVAPTGTDPTEFDYFRNSFKFN